MTWLTASLRRIAPPSSARITFKPDQKVWNLSLDQIESDTGEIVEKRFTQADEAGSSTFNFDTGNVLYSKLRPYLNKVTLPDEPGIATTELIPLRPIAEALDAKFLAYYLRSPAFVNQASHHVAGAKMPRVVMDWFWEHEAPLPPLSEQHRIVELLGQADALRRLRRAADAKAARILPALFLRMFGDPAANPKGWAVEPLNEISSPRQWPTISGKELTESGFPVYGANGKIGFYSSYNHEHPTVLITCRGATCGTINVCEPKSYVTGNAMALDDPDPNKTTIEFLETYLNVRGLDDAITGAAQPQITRQNLQKVNVFVPPFPLVEEFSEQARTIKQMLGKTVSAGEQVERTFALLLQKAFAGELTAKWRQAHMAELLQEMQQQAQALNLPLPGSVA
ncbi:restriction endonuclease subunit S [Stenotrophomonas sp. Marseille-Q4652]|uniref:restriction endonuclease subunit S n=1 Tax=Stenotrophomonas sp. Marseille-Q4652 TaxID=2866595 RepID=UPI001CE48F2D|nr:restriction endonuclease subunit S [Stenotrophomonas sp. Marseille-Q4652]